MRLDVRVLPFLSPEEFRLLTAIELGSRNHEYVPTSLIAQIAGIKTGIQSRLNELVRYKLIGYSTKARYAGYRLAYGGYDYLAMHTFVKRRLVGSIGPRIGVGKESDVYVVYTPENHPLILKIHRLGRISFRKIKEKRDYLGRRSTGSWMYLARLAARKEYDFMKTLRNEGFNVPKPYDINRHCILMERLDAIPLYQVSEVGDAGKLYKDLTNEIRKLARVGLIHSDFNEFNIMVEPANQKVWMIDFPQMVSTQHPNATEYFKRDVDCVVSFVTKRFSFQPKHILNFSDVKQNPLSGTRLDVRLKASGVTGKRDKWDEIFHQYRMDVLEEERCGSSEDESVQSDIQKETGEDGKDDQSESEQESTGSESGEEDEDVINVSEESGEDDKSDTELEQRLAQWRLEDRAKNVGPSKPHRSANHNPDLVQQRPLRFQAQKPKVPKSIRQGYSSKRERKHGKTSALNDYI